MGKIRTIKYGETEVQYDEDTPCIICGEPVIGASMGGTNICPSCDCGKCRYCGVKIFVLKEEVDNGKSKKNFLEHIEWHRNNTPYIVREVNAAHRRVLDQLEKGRK